MAPRSEYWQFYDKIDQAHAKCRSCLKIIKTCGNTTNLKLHTKKMHAELLDEDIMESSAKKVCRNKGNDSQVLEEPFTWSAALEVFDVVSECESGKSVVSGLSDSVSLENLSSGFQNIAEYVAETDANGERLSNAILYMICKDSQPFQIVENEGFLNLLKVAAPLYKVPPRSKFKRMLESKFEVAQDYFKIKIQEVDHLTLATQIWTDTMQCRSFLGVTINLLDGDKVQVATLGVAPLSEGEFISKKLQEICKEWQINRDKVMAVVTDGGENMQRGIEVALAKKCHLPCFAHMINGVVQKSMEESVTLPELIASVRKIVTWFKHSATASDALRKQTDRKLIQEVSPSWLSTFYMIDRFAELSPSFYKVITKHADAPPMLGPKQLVALTEICDVLRPIAVATREMCDERYAPCSKVIPLIRMLNLKISSLKPKQTVADILKSNILIEIKSQLLPMEHVKIFAISTLLDPRFKSIHFHDATACSSAIKSIKGMYVKVQSEADAPSRNSFGNKFDIWSEHHKIAEDTNKAAIGMGTDLESELDFFLKTPVLDIKQDPFEVWNHMIGSTYPKLRKVALQFLSCTAISTASERFFSKYTLCQQHSRPKGKALSKMLFLQSIDRKFWDV